MRVRFNLFVPIVAAMALSLFGCVTDFKSRPPAVIGLPVDDTSAPVSAVWIGHSTVLLRLGDKTILLDPEFAKYQVIYPRLTRASITYEQLPHVDFALVSHLHNDHFDKDALRSLGTAPTLIFPAGAEGYTGSMRGKVAYLDHWDTMQVDGVTVTAVPALHSGGSYVVDGWWNHSFCGYVLQSGGHTVFFAGDTGYDPQVFKEVGARFPGIELAFVPIAPARGGNAAHASPAEGVQIFQDLQAQYMVPIHYEAFYSSVIPYDEPRQKLAQAAQAAGVSDRVFALHTGERLVLPQATSPWVTRELPQPSEKMALKSP